MRLGEPTMRPSTRTWIYAALALAGLVTTVWAMRFEAPDARLRLATEEQVLARAVADAEFLGCRVSGVPSVQVSAGYRISSTAGEVQALVEQVAGVAQRRLLLERVPPVRLSARFHQAVGPEGNGGSLLLEYDGEGRLMAVAFGFGGSQPAELEVPFDMLYADFLAELLLGAPPPPPETSQQPGQYELVYQPEPGEPSVYVFLGPGMWLAHLQPVPKLVMSGVTMNFLSWHPLLQLEVYVLALTGLLALGLLLWRLPRQRAGFNQGHVVLTLLVLGLVPALKHYHTGDPRLLAALWIYLLLNQVAVWLGWAAAEAELREVRPRSLEPWDRMLCWQPLARTGGDLLRGLACGAALSGWLAASGVLARMWGGGYSSFLVILPDYWSLPTSLNWGLALAAVTTLLVSFGGRLGGRPGAIVGALLSGNAWAQVVPAAPLGVALGVGGVTALAAGWWVWHRGLLTLTVASVTALSLPNAWAAWSLRPWLLESAIISTLPLLLLPGGLWLLRYAPRHGDARAVMPAHVSQLEHQVKLQAEVNVLRDLQLSLLPSREAPMPKGIDVAWRMVPADLVGGDFFDLVQDSEGRLWLAMADVAGHGVSCSVLTAFTKAAVAEHAVAGRGPAEALARMRRLFGRLRTSRTLVTLLLAVWNPKDRKLRVATAGHPPLLVWDGGEIFEVGTPTAPLGTGLAGEEKEDTLPCHEGAVLVAYTDGVAEALSPRRKPFTYERWPQRLPELVETSAEEILEALLEEVDEHRAGRPAADDVTALVLKMEGC